MPNGKPAPVCAALLAAQGNQLWSLGHRQTARPGQLTIDDPAMETAYELVVV
jgi:hypothetical protein